MHTYAGVLGEFPVTKVLQPLDLEACHWCPLIMFHFHFVYTSLSISASQMKGIPVGISPRPDGNVSPSCARYVVLEESFEMVKGFISETPSQP